MYYIEGNRAVTGKKNNEGIARRAASVVGGIFPRDPACLGGRRGEIAAWRCISSNAAIMNYCFVKVSCG